MSFPDGPVLLTGATGFLGSHLLEALEAAGAEVRCLVRPSSDTRALEARGARVLRHSMDGAGPELASLVADHAVVVHAAGAIRALDYDGFLRANADLTERLALAALAAPRPPRRFVLVSSVGATGPAPHGEALTEHHPPGERTDYGRSKWEGEQRLLALAERLPCTIVRPTAIFGPRDKEMLAVLKLAWAGWLPAFAGSGQIYNLAHVDDIVQGCLLACQAPVPSGSTYLLGGPEERSAAELASLLGRVLERPVRLLPLPRALLWSAALASELGAAALRRPAMLNRQKIPELTGSWALDLGRARGELGYQPRVDLERGLRETVRWYRQRGLLGGP
jgi:nucleoside-diphosphate-sugar epimerase